MQLFSNSDVVKKQGIPLNWAILVAIVISIGLVTVSFIIFLNSGAYNTVKQIQAASTAIKDESIKDLDTKSPVQAIDLREYSDALQQRILVLNDAEDYGVTELDATTLGF